MPPRRLELMLVRLQMEQHQLGVVAAALLLRRRNQRKERRRRRYWVRPWIQRRSFYGNYANLMRELERESQGDFHQLHAHGTEHVPRIASQIDATIDEAGHQQPTCTRTGAQASHHGISPLVTATTACLTSFRVPHIYHLLYYLIGRPIARLGATGCERSCERSQVDTIDRTIATIDRTIGR